MDFCVKPPHFLNAFQEVFNSVWAEQNTFVG